MAYGSEQLKEILRRAGWPESLLDIMAAIGLAESSGDNSSYRVCNGDGFCTVRQGGLTRRVPEVPGQGREASAGLFQINLYAHPQYDRNRLVSDPVYNAKAALEIFRKQGLRAWGAYTDGRYKQYFGGTFAGSNISLPDAGAIGSGVRSWFQDWLFQPVQSSQDRFQPYLNNPSISGQKRYQIAVAIMIVVIVFAWREL